MSNFDTTHVVPSHSSAEPDRPSVLERAEYTPTHDVERFIVPLLSRWLKTAIAENMSGPGKRVIDVGCGRQPLRGYIEARGGIYKSIDAVQNHEKSVHHVAAIDAQLPTDLWTEGPFDLVVCTEVLEHVADWATAFDNLARLCAPGGRIIITCPHFYPPHEEPYDFWRPTPNALAWHARRSGLHVDSIERAGDAWDIIGTILGGHTFIPASRRFGSRLTAKLIRIGARFSLRVLKSGWVQQHCRASAVVLASPHMVNLAIFRK